MRWFLTIASVVRFHCRLDGTDPVYSHYKRHFWYCRSQNVDARQTRMSSSPSKNPSCTCRPEYTRKSYTASETHRTSWFALRTRLAWRQCARRSIYGVSVAAKNGAILAGLWPCFRWQQPLPAFPRAASRTIRFCTSLQRSSRTVKPPAR